MKILSKLFFAFLLIEFLVCCNILVITHPVAAKYQYQLVTFLKKIFILLTGFILETCGS